jgi:hypothetical protein
MSATTTVDADFEQRGNIKLTEKQRSQLHKAGCQIGTRTYEGRRLENVLAVDWITAGVILPEGGGWRNIALTSSRIFGGGSSMQLQEMER